MRLDDLRGAVEEKNELLRCLNHPPLIFDQVLLDYNITILQHYALHCSTTTNY